MILSSRPMRLTTAALVLTLPLVSVAVARNAPEKPKTVDSGTFAIFVGGQRVATETFRIEQRPESSTTTSEFKSESGDKFVQRSELQMTANGELRRYEWRELSPGKAQLTLESQGDFLLEHVTPNPPDKPVDQPLLLPPTTMVLDDYFFSHREVLAWRYLGAACGGSTTGCRPAKTQFGVVVPRQHTPGTATLEYAGVEKLTIKGAQMDVNRINLRVDDVEWVLWLDGNYKVLRMAIPSEKTEVVRE